MSYNCRIQTVSEVHKKLVMKSVIIVIAMIGCAVATSPIVTTLVTGYDQNTLHIQNGPPIGGSISAVLPSVKSIAPILTELATLALSLGNLASLSDLGSLGDLASLGNLGSIGNLRSLGELVSLGARLLPPIPPIPSVQFRSVPLSIPIPIPSFTPINYSVRASVPYPYSIYGGAGFY